MPLARRLVSLIAAGLLGLAACAALLSALPALAAPAGANILYPSAGCAGTLQACLDAAAPGDTIVIQPGTYLTNPLTLDHAVSLTGVSSATVLLQAVASQRVLWSPAPAWIARWSSPASPSPAARRSAAIARMAAAGCCSSPAAPRRACAASP